MVYIQNLISNSEKIVLSAYQVYFRHHNALSTRGEVIQPPLPLFDIFFTLPGIGLTPRRNSLTYLR